MDTEGYRSAPALAQTDRGVTDRYDSGRKHKPTKRVCGPVSYDNSGEQARRDVTNTFRGEIRPRMRLRAGWYAVSRGRQCDDMVEFLEVLDEQISRRTGLSHS